MRQTEFMVLPVSLFGPLQSPLPSSVRNLPLREKELSFREPVGKPCAMEINKMTGAIVVRQTEFMVLCSPSSVTSSVLCAKVSPREGIEV
jgi:hypothetical protein